MKKLVSLVLAAVLVVSLAACGGGGGGPAANNNAQTTTPTAPAINGGNNNPTPTTPTTDTSTTVQPTTPTTDTTPITTPPAGTTFEIKSIGFKPVSDNEKRVGITVAINATGAALIPNWKAGAQTVIDYNNMVFAKTTSKQFYIASYKEYADNGYDNAKVDPAYYYNNNFIAGRNTYSLQGLTVFVFAYTDFTQVPVSMGIHAGGEGTALINGVNYSLVRVVENVKYSALLGKAQVDAAANSVGHWENIVFTYLHEIGHGCGLTPEEGYNYIWTDESGVLPNLGSYNARTLYPNDVMYGEAYSYFDVPSPSVNYQFNDFDSWLIEKNANMQYSGESISPGIPAKVSVKVVDAQGYVVIGAKVRTFGAAALGTGNGLGNMKTMLEDLTTDVNGIAKLTTTEFKPIAFVPYGNWTAIGVKADSNGKVAGTTLKLKDLQEIFLRQGIDDYVFTLTLQ